MEPGLLCAFRRGERSALERIYRLHARDVERYARHVLVKLGRFTAADLADVVQDVFIRAFSDGARAQYDGERGYGPFLLRIAHNIIIDWARRWGRQSRKDLVFRHLAGDLSNGDDGPGVSTPPFDGELVAIADTYVRTLPAELRSVHHFRYVVALPQRQAAEALGISRQSLRTLERRLIVGLRQLLKRPDSVAPKFAATPATSAPAMSEGTGLELVRRR